MIAPADALPDERQRLILDRLSARGRVLAAELAREFLTSEDTIRRDLRELAAAGLCRRVYGGALPMSPPSATLADREAEAPERKAALGRAAATLVRPGQVVFLDAGSTNLAIARVLPAGITLVTNAPSIAAALIGRSDFEVVTIGGRVDPRSGAALGARALRDAREIRADLAFLGACSIDAKGGVGGVGAFDPEEAIFKSAMVESAQAVAVTVTTDKLGTVAPFTVMPAAALDHLVIEADAPDGVPSVLQRRGVAIHRAAPLKA